jgi:hypothetical protein
VDTTKVPLLAANNVFTKTQTIGAGDLAISAGNLYLSPTTSGGTIGVLQMGGPFLHACCVTSNTFAGSGAGNFSTTSSANTGLGNAALASATNGSYNTAVGASALTLNTSGSTNTALGAAAMRSNTTGASNIAVGVSALYANVTGGNNTVVGAYALANSPGASDNTAVGYATLNSDTNGYQNTAVGEYGLYSNSTGYANTATGYAALFSNTTGYANTAAGYASQNVSTGIHNTSSGAYSLYSLTSSSENTAFGAYALGSVATGNQNTAVGSNSLLHATGSNNIALGFNAGSGLVTGSNNVYIGNPGLQGEDNTIRIGSGGGSAAPHTALYLAAVLGTTVSSGQEMFIGSDGRIGTATSSRRYKDDIRDMAAASDGILKLRPVTFHYKEAAPDGTKPLQYGLVAEEVAQIYPDAVSYNEKGEPNAVQYHKINAMLINELQKQKREITQQQQEIDELKAALAALQSQIKK